MNHLFEDFLNKLPAKHKDLIESVLSGYSVIYEGWADTSEYDRVDAVESFNNRASQHATSIGLDTVNRVLMFNNRNADRFTIDEESELDNHTSSINFHVNEEDKMEYHVKKETKELIGFLDSCDFVAAPSDTDIFNV